jgi:hypothetical protein
MPGNILPTELHFRRLIRNARRASALYGRLVGAAVHHRGGHVYRLVPAKAFDEVLETLRRLGEPSPPISPTTEKP